MTGTNGKSTTARLIAAILGQAGPPAGNFEFGPALCAAPPDGPLVVEVSSFQLDAAPSVLPQVAVLTNLTDEHLGWHGSRAAYAAAKRRLSCARTGARPAPRCSTPTIRSGARSRATSRRPAPVVTYGEAADADMRIAGARWTAADARIVLAGPEGTLELVTELPGAHNARNVAAAAAAACALGVPDAELAAAVAATPRLPGRWERIDGGQPFDVLVDYAHTPDGVRAVLAAARAVVGPRPGAPADRARAGRARRPREGRGDRALGGSAERRRRADLRLRAGVRAHPAPRRAAPRVRRRRPRDAAARPARRDRRGGRRGRPGRRGDRARPRRAGRMLLDRRGTRLAHDDREAARAALRARGWDRWTS